MLEGLDFMRKIFRIVGESPGRALQPRLYRKRCHIHLLAILIEITVTVIVPFACMETYRRIRQEMITVQLYTSSA